MTEAATTATEASPTSAPVQTESTPAPQAEQAPVSQETKAPEAPKEPEIDFSSRFAALTRKERAILDKERQFKQYQNDPSYKEYLQFKELKANPRQNLAKFVELTGLPMKDFYEDLTGTILNDGKPSVELEVKTLKEQIEKDRREAAEQRQREEQAAHARALDGYKSEIVGAIEKKADDFELMKYYANAGSIDLATEVAIEYFGTHKKMLSAEEACQKVEGWLLEQSKGLLGLKKLGVKPPEVPPVETKDEPKIGAEAKPSINVQPKTLTNSNTVATIPTTQPAHDYLLDRDKRLKWSAEKLKKAWDEHGKT